MLLQILYVLGHLIDVYSLNASLYVLIPHLLQILLMHAGIPSLVVAAASFDDLVAITLYTIFISLAVTKSDGNLAWSIASGPLNVVFGLALGGAGARTVVTDHIIIIIIIINIIIITRLSKPQLA